MEYETLTAFQEIALWWLTFIGGNVIGLAMFYLAVTSGSRSLDSA